MRFCSAPLGGQEVGLAKFKLNTAEVLTLPTGGGAPSWAAMPNMLVRRSGHGAVVIDDTLYAVGGIGGPYNSALPAVEAFRV